MFSSSSQKKFFTFPDEDKVAKYRQASNQQYIANVTSKLVKNKLDDYFLTPEEEFLIVRHYEHILREFLSGFKPRHEVLPNDVKSTAFHFFKRFYLFSSVMDFHPKEMMITCIFLCCKICEYNVPIDLFVKNIEGNSRILKNIILDQELQLLHGIGFHLNVHSPHRAIEGLMLKIKAHSSLEDPERLYDHIFRFLSNMWHTDVCLLYCPALIALAAVMHAVSCCKQNIDNFIVQTLLNQPPEDKLKNIISAVRKIRSTVMAHYTRPPKEKIVELESKLAKCRNPRNNPSSEKFKRRMMEYALESYGRSGDRR